jgi:hypothetical protein
MIDNKSVEAWLTTLGCTIWGGRGWDITDEEERADAANWLVSQLVKLVIHTQGPEAADD